MIAFFTLLLAHVLSTIAQTYSLDTAYISPSSFLSDWDFFTGPDPTHGFVTYVDSATAQSSNLVPSDSGDSSFFLAVDSFSVLDPNGPGRKAVRITSQKAWTHGLFVADIAHMPAPACGIWPAFWMFGPNWPNGGEIDIIEGISLSTNNIMTLHTSSGCTMPPQPPSLQAGTSNNGQCGVDDNSNTGCGVTASSSATFGAGFNGASGGGIYATEWTSAYIKIWFFPHSAPSAIPPDLAAASASNPPTPAGWGTPQAFFEGGEGCDIDAHFMDMNLVFNTAFCGDWAGNQQLWSVDPVCGELAPTCADYVAANPAPFIDGNWTINSVKVFTLGAAAPSAAPAPPSSISSQSLPIPPSQVASTPVSSTVSTSSTLAPALSSQPSDPSTPIPLPPSIYSTEPVSYIIPPPPSVPYAQVPSQSPPPPQSPTSLRYSNPTVYSIQTIFVTVTATGLPSPALPARERVGRAVPLSSVAHASFHRTAPRGSAGCAESVSAA